MKMQYVCCVIICMFMGCGTEVGPTGPQGNTGVTGATGPMGPAGTSCTVNSTVNGATLNCSDGTSATITDGVNGAIGATGATGPQGNPGMNGSNGTNGTNGQNAMPCIVATMGFSAVITCPDGSQSIVNNPTMIQFCSSLGNTVYPSTFPEYGFCVGGNIYATYWNGNQAFTAEIVPGEYMSTSPQGCNFKVSDNCIVTEN